MPRKAAQSARTGQGGQDPSSAAPPAAATSATASATAPAPAPAPAAAKSAAAGRPYHHGDLRRAVLAAALEVIADDGPGAVSLRDLARRAGVSHAAPAHHFGDRAGLLTAIAAEGFGLLAEALGAAEGLRDAGVRYVRFARQRPAYFRVMFAPDLLRADDPELGRAREVAGERLREAVAGLPARDRVEDARLASVAAWSLAHGFATLLLGHNLDEPVGDRDPEDVFADLATMLFRPGS